MDIPQETGGVKMQGDCKALIEKLVAAQGIVKPAAKEGTNEYFNYSFYTEAQIATLCKAALQQVCLALVTSVEECVLSKIRNSKGNEETLATVQTAHTLLEPTTGATLTFHSRGQGVDPADKAVPKAITMSCKYALMKLFFVSDSADAEADGRVDVRFEGGQKSAPAPHLPAQAQAKSVAPPMNEHDAEADNMRLQLRQWCEEQQIPEAFIVSKCKETMVCREDSFDLYPHGVLKKLLSTQWQSRLAELWKEVVASGWAESYQQQEDLLPTEFPKQPPPVRQPAKRVPAPPPPAADDRMGGEPSPEEGALRTCHPGNPHAKKVVDWRNVVIHFGKHKGRKLGEIEQKSQKWFYEKWFVTTKAEGGKYDPSAQDWMLDRAVCQMGEELIVQS